MRIKYFFKPIGCLQKVVVLSIVISSFLVQSLFAQRGEVLPELSAIFKSREASATPKERATFESQRKWIIENGLNFNVGATGISRKNITPPPEGGKMPSITTEVSRQTQNISDLLSGQKQSCFASARSYDARKYNYITPVKDKHCQFNDYAFAAIAAYEASYMRINNLSRYVDFSEQQVANCFLKNLCTYFYHHTVFQWMFENKRNFELESVLPNGSSATCPGNPDTDYGIVAWGMIRPIGDNIKMPTVQEIKEAICKYGAVSSAVKMTALFINYTNGVFFDFENRPYNKLSEGNHDVLIIGWDDDKVVSRQYDQNTGRLLSEKKGAWLIKNSWGTDWGEDGYMWISYNSSDIGKRSAWVVAKKSTAVRQ